MATPSLAMIPSAYADSKVYSVLPNNGDGDFTFNRDSSATRVGQNGLIQTVGAFGNELITNGDFATDTNWSKGAGWTISGGSAKSDGTASNSITQLVSLPTGTLKIKFDVTARTQGNVRLFINKPAFSELFSADAVGSYEVDVVTTSGANNVYFYSTNSFIGSIDNVSVQQILGDQPRLNYDISNGGVQSCPSLLLEPTSTNIVPYSEDLSQWTLVSSGTGLNPVVTTNNSISPDGTINADKILFNSGGGTTSGDQSTINKTVAISSGTDATASIYLKGENGGEQVLFRGVASSSYQLIILTKDWQRFITTENSGTTGDIIEFGIRQSVSGFGIVNSSATVYAWGGQIEQQSFATSYIPTYGSSQTRAAETCNGAGNASTFNSTEGVLYAEIKNLTSLVSSNNWLTISDGTTSNFVALVFETDGKTVGRITAGGSSQAFFSITGDYSLNQKLAFKWKENDFAFWINGVKVGTDSAGSVPNANTLDNLQFNYPPGGNNVYGNVKDIRVYNEALTDAQLTTLTTL